jgi:cytochrome c
MSGCNLESIMLAGAITVGIIEQPHAQDAANGEHLFRIDCSICHSPQPGRNLIGPGLFNVINRHSGEIADYRYSDANRQSGLTWNVATLDRYLTAPRD